jgi:oxygen-independent coproporphyrinogen-3 oxidase
MKIAIKGLHDDRYHRPLSLISDLFFEETEVFVENSENDLADINITFSVEEVADTVLVQGILGGDTVQHDKDLTSTDEKERFRLKKQAVSYVYLTLLQNKTGIIQKWGILTGIRPTKLLHSKLQKGEEKEKVHQQLREDYLITDEKIALMQEIVDRQLSVVPDLYKLGNEVSIYIGIPFCPTKCAYCTFPAYAINGKQGKVDSFLGGLHHEIKEIGAWLKEKGIKITTVYYGGGTPTSITAQEMDMLYEEMYEAFPDMDRVREVTVEAGRPDTITPEKLEVLKKWNIDRISINPQSYTQETLKAIGRHHTVEETIEKFHLAREMGMNNINMDLIIGLPGEGVEEFAHTLQETEKLMPESLTVHTLSFKRASEMTQNKRKYKVADRNEISRMMDMATEWTLEHDYVPYYLYRQKNILGNLENVGYALPGQDSIYNIMIMEEKQTIIGLGCGASSKFVHPTTGKSYNDGFHHYTEEKIRILDELFFSDDKQ